MNEELELEYKNMEIFYKFCLNRIDYEIFREMMIDSCYVDEIYIEDKWIEFRKNPIGFIVGRTDKKLFLKIKQRISSLNYKG